MYKFLLCLRYLRTRYIALASIISVTLGVATMIVVNSVMSGFQHEMIKRLHGILSDVVVEAHSLEGIENPADVMATIRDTLGRDVRAMTANVHMPAILSFPFRGQLITKQVSLIGVDRKSYADVSDFGHYLLHAANRSQLSFDLHKDGYDSRLGECGWIYRRQRAKQEREYEQFRRSAGKPQPSLDVEDIPENPFQAYSAGEELAEPEEFRPEVEQHPGIVLGIAIANVRQREEDGSVGDYFLCRPGDDVIVTFPSAGTPPKAIHTNFTVVDFYESKMSEYDASFAFVPIDHFQRLRGMIDPVTGVGAVTAIQIRLAEGVDLDEARDRLQARFPRYAFPFHIQTWRDMQGPLLAAVQMETTILNLLLFLIIAVAGFGILATFFMIVVEKTRDIGILKSLGASSPGIMSIFLGYGLALGIVGALVGLVLGLAFVWKINDLARLIQIVTGREVFDPTVYYFQEIPTLIHVSTVTVVMIGAVTIAVAASILPALRAARLQPVQALRFE